MGIVTAGDRPRVESDLEQVGLASEISVVVTKDDVQRPKPHPEGLLSALSQLDSHVQEAIYVGDTVVDYHTARNAPMPFVGKRSDFGAAWPDGVAQVDHIHQVVELLLG